MLLCRQARDPEIWEGGCSGLLSGIDGPESLETTPAPGMSCGTLSFFFLGSATLDQVCI